MNDVTVRHEGETPELKPVSILLYSDDVTVRDKVKLAVGPDLSRPDGRVDRDRHSRRHRDAGGREFVRPDDS